jgi:hypothetical protein
MKIHNPMHWIAPDDRKKVLIFLLLAVFLTYTIFSFLDMPLRSEAAPFGIISFELAGSQENARQILNSWDMNAKLFAAFGLGFDYLFMVLYGSCISLICLMASERHTGWFSILGIWLGWGAVLAALFDSIENIALWNMLSGPPSVIWSPLAMGCAILKFSILIFGISYPFIAWIIPNDKKNL